MRKQTPWDSFLNLCLTCKNKQELSELLQLFLTFEEREMLSSRVAIIQYLLKGNIPQREISEKLQASIAQITRGSNALKITSENLKKRLLAHVKGESA
jgi:TrpR family trp operon transcriptional repressor